MVGRRRDLNVSGLVGNSAGNILAADDDCHLNAEILHFGQFRRHFMDACGIDAKSLRGRQGLALRFSAGCV